MGHTKDARRRELLAIFQGALEACRGVSARDSTVLGDLEVSTPEFMQILAMAEDCCHADLTDPFLARCVTLGDVIDSLIACRPSAKLRDGLGGDAKQSTDTGGYSHGERAPERYARHRPPRARPAGLGSDETQQRQAS